MTDLPVGWTEVTLGEIADSVKNGIFVSRPGVEPNGVPVLRISAVRPGTLQLDDVRYSAMSEEDLAASDSLLTPGDLLFTRYNGNIDYVGACALVPPLAGAVTYPDKLIRVRLDASVVAPEFVSYAFEAPVVRAQVRAVARTTAGQAGISGSSLKAIYIPLPPLTEQRRIVAALEGCLSRLATGGSLLEAGKRRLVALDSAGSRSMQGELSGAPTVCLGDLISEPLRNGHSAPASDTGAVRTITLSAVTQGEFSGRFTKMTGADSVRVRDLWLRSGDILIQRSNTPELVGTSALYRGPNDWAIFPDLLIRVRLREDVIPEYILLVLQSPESRRYFRSRAKGLAGSMPKIDQQTIRALPLKLPSVDQQVEIVRQARELKSRIENLRAVCVTTTRRSTRLRASLLTEAFAGRLVPQDPGDEPASELLARIQAERATAAPKQKARAARTRKELAAPPTRVTGDNYQQEALPL